MEVDVIITTWGSEQWYRRGVEAALAHDDHDAEVDVLHFHFDTNRSAGAHRNHAVSMSGARSWLCFLDADDRLDASYFRAMAAACEHERQLLTPALQLGDAPARVLDDRDIINGLNPCPIGTLIHRSLFDEVDGFGDEPAWEDFAMFQRAVLIGAEIKFVPEAVYLATHNPLGRNSTVRNPKWLLNQIREDNRRWLASR